MSYRCVSLVMAGGRSERMRAGRGGPHKALRLLHGRTLIEWNIDTLRHFGFEEIYVAVNGAETELIRFVQGDRRLKIISETAALGTVGAASRLPDGLTDVLVINVDNLTDLDLRAVAKFHCDRGAAMTIATHEEPFRIPFGRLRLSGNLVTAYEEKPLLSMTISSGTYVLNRRAIASLATDRRTDVPELVQSLLRNGHTVCAYPHSARWVDVNDEAALERASEITRSHDVPWPGIHKSSENRIRVLAIIPDLMFGGGETRVLQIASQIDTNRFEYKVVTLFRPDPELLNHCGDMLPDFERAGIMATHLDLRRPRRMFRNRMLQRTATAVILGINAVRLWRYLVREKPNMIDAHLDGTVLTVVPAALLADVPVGVTLYEAPNQRGLTRTLWRAALRRATIFTDSRARATDLAHFTGQDSAGIGVIPTPVKLPNPALRVSEMRRKLGVSESSVVVAQIAGMVPAKGYEDLLHAAATFLRECPRAFMLGIGHVRQSAGYDHSLRRLAAELGIADRVCLTAWPDNIADVWRVVDIHVHASRIDSLPNAVIEAMSLGKPAVVTSVGGIPELVINEETALVVPPADPQALSAAILRLLRDDSLRLRLGEAARRRYEECCAPHVILPKLESRFAELADRKDLSLRRIQIRVPE